MSFITKLWKNGPSGGTPLSAAALIDLEERTTAYSELGELKSETVTEGKIKNLAVTEGKLATAVQAKLLSPETPGALSSITEAEEKEPSATKATLVTGYVETKSATRTSITITNNAVIVFDITISATSTGTTLIPFTFLVQAGKKWEWNKIEGTVEAFKASYQTL